MPRWARAFGRRPGRGPMRRGSARRIRSPARSRYHRVVRCLSGPVVACAAVVLSACVAPPRAEPCNSDARCRRDERCEQGVCVAGARSIETDDDGPPEDAGRPRADDAGGAHEDAGDDAGDDLGDDDGDAGGVPADADAGGAPPGDAGGVDEDGGIGDAGVVVDAGDDFTALPPAPSCADHLAQGRATTGRYRVERDQTIAVVHCDMTLFGGGFERVFLLDVADCPPPLERMPEVAACGRPSGGVTTLLVGAPTSREVAGLVRGVRAGDPDAFTTLADVEAAYVDGVAITRGAPRRHLFTYVAGRGDGLDTEAGSESCPCLGGLAAHAFVQGAYRCDTAPRPAEAAVWNLDDPLWNVEDALDDACAIGSVEHFLAVEQEESDDDVEVRVMTNSGGEDIALTAVELYVR